jgi:hypothetical protein
MRANNILIRSCVPPSVAWSRASILGRAWVVHILGRALVLLNPFINFSHSLSVSSCLI